MKMATRRLDLWECDGLIYLLLASFVAILTVFCRVFVVGLLDVQSNYVKLHRIITVHA